MSQFPFVKSVILKAGAAVLLLLCLAACLFGCGRNTGGPSSAAPASLSQSQSAEPSQAEAEPEPQPEPQPQELLVRVSAVGDNLVHDGLYIQARNRAGGEGYDFNYCFEGVQPFFEDFDVNWMNQETLINSEYAPSGYPMFSTPAEMANAAYAAGWRVFALANNHSYDLGAGGIAATRAAWAAMPNDVVTVGLFEERTPENGIALQEINGMTVAYLSYTDHTNGLPEPAGAEAFVIYTSEIELIEQQVRHAAQIADAVVVGVHWEVENSHDVTDAQRILAAHLADWGATVVIGTHPHVIQPIEMVTGNVSGRTIPVAYSLGNFISAQSQANQLVGLIFTFDLTQTVQPDGERGPVEAVNVKAVPCVTHYESGYGDIRTYLLRDYSDALAAAHGVRSRYGAFSLAYITELCQTYVSSNYLQLD